MKISLIARGAAAACALMFAESSFAVLPGNLPKGTNSLWQKGHLDAYYYFDYTNKHPGQSANAATTTAKLNEAIKDSYVNHKVLYLRAGTYWVNDTLKAYADGEDKNSPAVGNGIQIVGEANNALGRPILKLVTNAPGFADPSKRKILLDFLTCADAQADYACTGSYVEKPGRGYFHLLRGINLHTNGNRGAVGLYFNQAQDSSIEDVKVFASGSVAGIWGLPSRGSGGVNIEVDGGRYGIDTSPTDGRSGRNVGSVIAGVKLTNQTISAIRHDGEALTIVGFEIAPAVNVPAMTFGTLPVTSSTITQDVNLGAVNLIDGKITMKTGSAATALVNTNERNIYVRNVYITGTDNLVKSANLAPVAATGMWKRVQEYSYSNTRDPNGTTKTGVQIETWNLINKVKTQGGETRGVISSSSVAPAEKFIRKHAWVKLPSIDDTDIDAIFPSPTLEPTYPSPYTLNHVAFQQLINSNRKIFLRPGIFKLTGPITLKANTILFGAGKLHTRIEVDESFPIQTCIDPATGRSKRCNTPVIATDNNADATTYIGGLSIGVPANDPSRDYFTALDWRAGRNSMVHMGRPYHVPDQDIDPTNPHDFVVVRGFGGGRWYFFGRGQEGGMANPDYRILKVTGTTQPLWFYGLNLEHARTGDAAQKKQGSYAEFTNARNVRIFTLKTESDMLLLEPDGPYYDYHFLMFSNVDNIGLFGHTSITHSPDKGYNHIYFKGTHNNVVATLVLPREKVMSPGGGGNTLYSTNDGAIAFPKGVGLFRKGTLNDAAMVHSDTRY